MRYIIIYFAVISFITAAITCYDKISAKKGMWRIPEKTLFALAVIGGAVAEYFVMRVIRHKTLHKRFMIGLPLIIILQLTIIFTVIYFTQNVSF